MSEIAALRITAPAPEKGFSYRLRYTFMPGDFRAQQDEGAIYRVPFGDGESFGVAQAFGGKASHGDKQNYYAVDIVMPVGTPVLAARDGVVMTVDNDFFGAGLDMARYGDRANNIRIVHSDGTMAVYAHLELESAHVQVGDRVRAGQLLALSGDTGYTSGPHLHFCVQVNVEHGADLGAVRVHRRKRQVRAREGHAAQRAVSRAAFASIIAGPTSANSSCRHSRAAGYSCRQDMDSRLRGNDAIAASAHRSHD